MNQRPSTASTVLCALVLGSPLAAMAGGNDVVPVATPPAAAKDDSWEFLVKPYGWLSGVNGTLAAGGFSTDVDVDPTEVVSHLDWAVFLQAEARHGRWGLLFDGFYAQLSGGGTPPNGLYSESNFTQTQGMVELALAYRVLEGQAGYVDLFAGARYLNVEIDLQAELSASGVRQVSERASARVVESIASRAEAAVASRHGEITAAADNKIQSIKNQIIAALAPKIIHHLRTDSRGLVAEAARAEATAAMLAASPDVRGAIAAVVDARVASARAGARHRADARLAAAEKRLAKAIERELRDRLPESSSGGIDWIDPFIGVRGQWNISDKIFVAGRADIGAFGVDDVVTWQLAASLGWQINTAWSTELGYRIMDQEHTEGEVTYDMNTAGFFVSLGYRF